MPFLYVGLNYYGSFLRRLSKHAKQVENEASEIAGESLSNIRTVRAFSAEDRELEKYTRATEEAGVLNRKLGFHVGAFQGLMSFSIGSMIMSILYVGGNQVVCGDISGGELMTYMVATQSAARALCKINY